MTTERRVTDIGDVRVTDAAETRVVLHSGREIEQALADAVTSKIVAPFIAMEMFFDSGPLRLWTGVRDFVYLSNTYTGAGTVLAVSQIEETVQIKASGLVCRLSGVSASVKSLVLAEPYSGRAFNLHFGALNTETHLLIAATQVFAGLMDQMTYEPDGAETVEVSLTVEHELVRLEGTNERRYTPEDQKSRYPGDTFFDFKDALQDRDIFWRSG